MKRNSTDLGSTMHALCLRWGCLGPEMQPSNVCRNAGSLPSCLPTKLHSSRGDSFFFLFFPPSWHKSGKWVLIVLN